MKTLHRNKRKLYLCQVYRDEQLRKYKEPMLLFENWQVTNTDSNFMNLGLESYDFITIKTDVTHAKYYHLGDRLYINVTPPEKHHNICKTADYEVYKEPLFYINEGEIMLKRLSTDWDDE